MHPYLHYEADNRQGEHEGRGPWGPIVTIFVGRPSHSPVDQPDEIDQPSRHE